MPKGFYAMFRTKKDLDNYTDSISLCRSYTRKQLDIDAWIIALHDEFGFGTERCKKALQAYLNTDKEIADLIINDHKDDERFEYTKTRIDNKLKEALGDLFVPFEERYKME